MNHLPWFEQILKGRGGGTGAFYRLCFDVAGSVQMACLCSKCLILKYSIHCSLMRFCDYLGSRQNWNYQIFNRYRLIAK